jgi:hypothetical protein
MGTPIQPDDLAEEVVKYAPRWVREGTAKPDHPVSVASESANDDEAPWHGPSPFDEGASVTEDAIDGRDVVDVDILEDIPGSELLTPIEGPFKTAAEVSFALIAALAFALVMDDTLAKMGSDADEYLFTASVAAPAEDSPAPAAVANSPQVTSAEYVVAGFNSATSFRTTSLPTPVEQPPTIEPVSAPQTPQMTAQPQAPQVQQVVRQQSERVLDPDEVDQLVNRGAAFLAQGDIAAARLFLLRAAEARDARATLMLGTTYDPEMLYKLGVVGIRSDAQQAQAWYAQAADLGSSEASRRLAGLAISTR